MMSTAIRIFSREGVRDLWINLHEVMYDKSTRPAELVIASIIFVQGLFWIFSTGLFTKFSSYQLLYQHPGQTWAGVISVSLSLLLTYGLIGYKRDQSHYDDVPRKLWNKVDSYFGENKMFMSIRRNSLVLMTGWTFYIAAMMAISTPSAPGYVTYTIFTFTTAFCMKRLRRDETEVRRALVSSRLDMDVEETVGKIDEVFSTKIYSRGDEHVSEYRRTDQPGSMGRHSGISTS